MIIATLQDQEDYEDCKKTAILWRYKDIIDSTLTEIERKLIFVKWDAPMCETGGKHKLTHAFVLCCLELVLNFYWVGETTMCSHSQNGVELKHFTVIFLILVLNIYFTCNEIWLLHWLFKNFYWHRLAT